MPHPDDRAPAHGREDAAGGIWFTIREDVADKEVQRVVEEHRATAGTST
ncbi:hypothetical protein [Streptomyces sp. SGAir0924]|nr:hypothetical protein [Streptomyces sp. SGAir0924]